jgi:hypothetical protein
MNRLSPLIVRHSGAAALPVQIDWIEELGGREPGWLDDLKLFATGWLGGFVFFLTFLG